MKIRIKPVYYWFTIFALCSLSFQMVQDYIRPNYNGDHLLVKYLLGIAPNFFPSIGIPALFVILIPSLIDKNNTNKWLNKNRHITAILISFFGLVSWEFLQLYTSKGKFDWHDVLWTLIGSLLFQLIWTITPKFYKDYDEEEKLGVH